MNQEVYVGMDISQIYGKIGLPSGRFPDMMMKHFSLAVHQAEHRGPLDEAEAAGSSRDAPAMVRRRPNSTRWSRGFDVQLVVSALDGEFLPRTVAQDVGLPDPR
jgi:hypothetical protein